MPQTNPYAAPNAPVSDVLDNESTGQIKLLTPKGRMGRVRYLYYSMLSGLITMLIIAAGAALLGVNSTLGAIVIGIGYLAMLILGFFYLIQRCHDLNKSGWWSLLMFIPFAIFYFYFAAGTPGANHFGLKPPENTKAVIAGAIIIPILTILLSVAGSALLVPQLAASIDDASKYEQMTPSD